MAVTKIVVVSVRRLLACYIEQQLTYSMHPWLHGYPVALGELEEG